MCYPLFTKTSIFVIQKYRTLKYRIGFKVQNFIKKIDNSKNGKIKVLDVSKLCIR